MEDKDGSASGEAREARPIVHIRAQAERPVTAVLVRSILRARRLREAAVGPGLFTDAAWDMLLDLLAARLEGAKVTVGDLRLATQVPQTTALRWIKVLETRNLVIRSSDPDDLRRVHVALTEDAAATMTAILSEAQAIVSPRLA